MSSVQRVQLAVYDLSRGMATTMSQAILGQRIDGIWHTGIVVYSCEYYFGGGIQVSPTGYFARSNQLQPVQMLDMGTTTKSKADLEQYLQSINNLFTQQTYDLINNNCNNFADNICRFLTSRGIPEHIVDLPRIVFSTPGGAMLRPMIEGMQNNIRQQQGSGMDPFGGGRGATSSTAAAVSVGRTIGVGPASSAAPTPQQFESTLSDSVRAVAMNMARNASSADTILPSVAITTTPTAPIRATLEEQALVSGDASTVHVLGRKILNLAGADGVAGSALTAEEREFINTVLTVLSSPTVGASGTAPEEVRFPIAAYALFERLIASHPTAHLSCLFLLRLMLLHDRASPFDQLSIVREIVRRLLASGSSDSAGTSAGGKGDVTATSSGFASIPAHVMALCAMSNLLSHEQGAQYVLYGTNSNSSASTTSNGNEYIHAAETDGTASTAAATTDSAESSTAGGHIDDLVDIALGGLSHSRAEVRQMSAALAYNYTLLCTQGGRLSGPWGSSSSGSDNVNASGSNSDSPSSSSGSTTAMDVSEDTTTHAEANTSTANTTAAVVEVELNPHALQLLCGSLEGLLEEADLTVRRRRLAIICRIFRAYGRPAVDLAVDLGFEDQLRIMYGDSSFQPALTKEEREILAEINHAL